MSDGIGKLAKGMLSAVTLGTSDMLLGGLEADMPTAPEQKAMDTGNVVASKGAGSFDEEAGAKSNARKTARKGTSQFRIPLVSKAGAKTGGSSGLKI